MARNSRQAPLSTGCQNRSCYVSPKGACRCFLLIPRSLDLSRLPRQPAAQNHRPVGFRLSLVASLSPQSSNFITFITKKGIYRPATPSIIVDRNSKGLERRTLMASGAISTRPQAENAPTQGRYGDFIQKRLEHTRRQVRLVDVATSAMLLVIASLVFFLMAAVLDHWVFQHGLSFLARLGLFALWVAGAGAFIWRFVVPPLANRINPVFAAQTIEQGRPTLKNSLINFLLLRSHPQDVAPLVYRAMEHRAAADLLKVPVDHALDRGRVVHLACVLAAVVGVFALYLALSPKNPFVSAARVLWPWSSVAAPTRVHIE